ncbi:hypothetical protein DMB66_21180 [Actinoplanes sp. ATCC 53533]|uniref:hypothetical protein n=1 Tax=Actinoplanes sp. ATCC 53533 TaxID=1288362 RepID=UPI000F78A735|nr:hypothetical protein [Actinoplanes sp. ATCC 53533]RSM64028.1 hypothetical protein DMB66_21180 [Actinoplanes sp. ATCC 53533]
MSFDYTPPRWWAPVLVLSALIGLALSALFVAVLGYSMWQLLQVLSGPGQALLARIDVILGPFRLPPDPAGG